MNDTAPIVIDPRLEVIIEVQTEAVPFLRDNGYPAPKLKALEAMMSKVFDKQEANRGRGPGKGKGGRPRKATVING